VLSCPAPSPIGAPCPREDPAAAHYSRRIRLRRVTMARRAGIVADQGDMDVEIEQWRVRAGAVLVMVAVFAFVVALAVVDAAVLVPASGR
jgi:hypothetical protein